MKKSFLVILAALVSTVSFAAKKDEAKLNLTINSESGIYHAGETATIYAQGDLPEGTVCKFTVNKNGSKVVDTLITVTSEPVAVFSEVCEKTKWMCAKIAEQGNEKECFNMVGYVVEPEKYLPVYKAPEDLYEYWEDQVAQLRKTKMKAKVESVETPAKYEGKVKCWHVTINMPEGRPVNAYVAVPAGAVKGSLPIVMYTHGASPIDKKTVRSDLNKAIKGALKGAIAMDINAHGMEDEADASYYAALKEELQGYQNRELTTKEDYYFRLMYLRLVRALDYLTSLKEWNKQYVMVSGGSQGGGQALALGGIDPRVTHVHATVPALCDLGGLNKGRQGGWPYSNKKYKKVVKSDTAKEILPYFDAALLVKRYSGKLFIEVGFVDTSVSASSVYCAYNNAKNAEKTLLPFIYRRHTTAAPGHSKELTNARKKAFDEWSAGFNSK